MSNVNWLNPETTLTRENLNNMIDPNEPKWKKLWFNDPSLTWTYGSGKFYTTNLLPSIYNDITKYGVASEERLTICTNVGYTWHKYDGFGNKNYVIGDYEGGKQLSVKDASYSTVQEFLTANSNTYLFYLV